MGERIKNNAVASVLGVLNRFKKLLNLPSKSNDYSNVGRHEGRLETELLPAWLKVSVEIWSPEKLKTTCNVKEFW